MRIEVKGHNDMQVNTLGSMATENGRAHAQQTRRNPPTHQTAHRRLGNLRSKVETYPLNGMALLTKKGNLHIPSRHARHYP